MLQCPCAHVLTTKQYTLFGLNFVGSLDYNLLPSENIIYTKFFPPEKFSDYGIMLPTLHSIAPGPVSELSYEKNTNTSVTITWKPPKEPNGDLVAYFVEHGVYRNESTRSVRIDARRPTSAVIQALGK